MILQNQGIADVAYVKSLVSRYLALQGVSHELRCAGKPEFILDMKFMRFHRFHTDKKFFSDLFQTFSFSYQREYFFFAFGEYAALQLFSPVVITCGFLW